MYAVVVGGGSIGSSVARWLVSAGHEVVVIDRDVSRCEAVEEELGSVTITGDGTEAEVLTKAGANRAGIFIAATGRDDQNLTACQLAKYRFGASRTMALANLANHRRLLELAGVDVVIDATGLVLDRVKDELTGIDKQEQDGL